MSLNNKPDGNRLVDHFKYLIAKGHQVEDGQIPSFVSNIGSTRKEIIEALEGYRDNFIESKRAGTMSRNVRLLGKGIVFCNLPYSMTSEEHTELIERVRAALPPEMPQIYVFHHQNRAGNKYPHLHLMLGVNGDGGTMMSKDFRDSFHEKLIDVMNNFTNELGYKRQINQCRNQISCSTKIMVRSIAKKQAIEAGEIDAHQGMLKRLNSPQFWLDVKCNDIPGIRFISPQLNEYAYELAMKCIDIKAVKHQKKSNFDLEFVSKNLNKTLEMSAEAKLEATRIREQQAEAPKPQAAESKTKEPALGAEQDEMINKLKQELERLKNMPVEPVIRKGRRL